MDNVAVSICVQVLCFVWACVSSFLGCIISGIVGPYGYSVLTSEMLPKLVCYLIFLPAVYEFLHILINTLLFTLLFIIILVVSLCGVNMHFPYD